MSSSKNLEQEKTSFLNKSNSAFIEDMYIRFIENDPNLPESWKKYFDTLDDDIQSVQKRLSDLKNPKTGEAFFTPAVGISLMLFYAFPMLQVDCLSETMHLDVLDFYDIHFQNSSMQVHVFQFFQE